MVQNLNAYLLYMDIKIKWSMCVQEKIQFFSVSQRPQLNFDQNLWISLRSKKDKVTVKHRMNTPRGGKKLASCCLGVAFATSCQPMATGLISSTGWKNVFDIRE